MDCVGCDKCRLWGKLQVTGLGTALKLLFSYDGEFAIPLPSSGAVDKDDPSASVLSRSEVVAFVNTLHRLSESLVAVEKFRTLWAHRSEVEKKTNAVEVEVAKVTEGEDSEKDVNVSGDKVDRVEWPTPSTEDVAIELEQRSHVSTAREPGRIPTSSRQASVKGVLERLVDLCRGGWRSCLDSTGQQWLKTEL